MSDDMNDDKLDGRSFGTDQQLSVSIMEAKPGDPLWTEDSILPPNPEKIGVLSTDRMHATVYVPRDAFAHFWTAAEATDGSTRDMELELKPDVQGTLTVTDIGLFESMPGSALHPVVVELRVMREKAKSIVVGFAVVLIAWILLSIFRHF